MNSDRIRAIVENAEISNRLYLIKNGIPFDVAMSLQEHEVLAYAIIFGKIDGGKWDWSSMSWSTDS